MKSKWLWESKFEFPASLKFRRGRQVQENSGLTGRWVQAQV